MSREGKRLSGKQWNRGSKEAQNWKADMKRNAKVYYRDRSVDDHWTGDDYLFTANDFDDDLCFDADLEEKLDEEVDE